MLGDVSGLKKIYIVCGYTDMRKSIDGLCTVIEDQLKMDPSSSALFLFCGRRRDRIKALFREPDGFVLRKNWLFSSSVDGANASAVVYTMVEMAKAHGLNIYGYLKFLLENRPSKNMTDEQLAELAPWSEKLQSIKNRM